MLSPDTQRGVWSHDSQKTEPSFDIRIKASSDEDFAVTMGFVMNATYPKTPPLLTIKGSELREATQFKIQKFLETEPKLFAKDEQEMVDKIVEGIRDILEDAAQAKANGKHLPSLEEERERHEANVAVVAQQHREEVERKRMEESKEEERVMAEMINRQIDRQKRKGEESKSNRKLNDMVQDDAFMNHVFDGETIDFDQSCNAVDRSGNIISFRSVAGKCEPRPGQVSSVYTVRPVLGNSASSITLALKEAVLRCTGKDGKDSNEFKRHLQSFESRLQDLKMGKGIQHRHLVEIFDFKVESGIAAGVPATNCWTLSVLSPLAEKGSLEELLELAGHIEVGKVRSWTRDLLDALNFLHNKNIVHQDMHSGNILLFKEPTGEIVPKVSDTWYQREIHNFSPRKQGLPGLASAKSAYWLPPEIAAASKPQYTFKTDIWDFGVIFVQMLFGMDALRKYSSPKNLMESLTLSQPLQELVGRFFKGDKQKRPRAFELGSSEFLATDAPILFEDSSNVLLPSPSMGSLQSFSARRRDSTTRGAVLSRYTEDFVEEGRLGKGGFGEVVKARKKLDGQIYAIKKITQHSQASLTEILKEVRLLSQLSHPAVVRYYNTWVEEVPDLTDTEGETSTDDFTGDSVETGTDGMDIQFATSTGGLDFMSSNAAVEFGYDDESDEEESTDGSVIDDKDSSADEDAGAHPPMSPQKDRRVIAPKQSSRFHRPFKTILYISMEYCEKRVG